MCHLLFSFILCLMGFMAEDGARCGLPFPSLDFAGDGLVKTLANVLRPSALIWGTGVTPTVISYRERCSNERFERSRRE